MLCGDPTVEMHPIRSVKGVMATSKTYSRGSGFRSGYQKWIGAFRRKQIPLCSWDSMDLTTMGVGVGWRKSKRSQVILVWKDAPLLRLHF